MVIYLGFKGVFDNGFIESLYSDLNIRNVFFWEIWENLIGLLVWLLRDVDDVFFFVLVFDLLWVLFSLFDMVDDVLVGVGGGLRLLCEILFGFVFFGLFLLIFLISF